MGFEIVDNLNAENMEKDDVWNPWIFPSFFSAMKNHPEFQSPAIGWLLVIGLYNTMQDDFDHTANDFDGMGR